MTDHHAEYEAAARRKSADAMVADVRHMRDRYRLAAECARIETGRLARVPWWYVIRRGHAREYDAKADALDGLLRKWGNDE